MGIFRLAKRHLTNKGRSIRSEKRAAKIHQGRVQPASGALPVVAFKADVISKHLLIDDKTTNSKSFAINFAKWKKLRREAFINHKKPAWRLESLDTTLCVVEEEFLLELMTTYKTDEISVRNTDEGHSCPRTETRPQKAKRSFTRGNRTAIKKYRNIVNASEVKSSASEREELQTAPVLSRSERYAERCARSAKFSRKRG